MENPEKDILKNVLQDTFLDWEAEPSQQTWHTIQQAIQPSTPGIGVFLRQWFLPLLGLFLSVGSLLVWNMNQAYFTAVAINERASFLSKSAKKYAASQNNKAHLINKLTDNYKESTLINSFNSVAKQQELIHVKLAPQKIVHLEKNKPFVTDEKRTLLQANIYQTNTVSSQEENPLITQNEQNSSTIKGIDSENKLFALHQLKEKQGVFTPTSSLKLPSLPTVSTSNALKAVQKEHFFSISITPIQTYRIFTVMTKEVQQLQKNSLFNTDRNGFAIELGIHHPLHKNGYLRGAISYLTMKQWAEYQVVTNEVVVNNSKLSTAIESVLATKTEDKTMEMVGIKADYQQFIQAKARNRYFLSLGSQLMYDPTNKHANLFVNASAGFQHIVNTNCFITIEPTVAYSINNISESNSLLQTNVYNVGVKMGLSVRIH